MRLRYPIAYFVIALWLGSLVSFTLGRDFYPKEFENRSWAPFPNSALLKEKPAEYFRHVNNYVADYFGLRNSFIRVHNALKYVVFHTSPNELVLLGKNKSLFWAGEDSLNFYRNVFPYTDDELTRLTAAFEKTYLWLKKRHIDFVVMIPPDPPNIYPERVPKWVRPLHPQSRRQQLIGKLNTFLTIPTLDFTDALVKARELHDPYYITDSHWNIWGAYIATREVIHSLQKTRKKLPELPTFTFSYTSRRGLDLSSAMGLPDYFEEKMPEIASGQCKYEKHAEPGAFFFDFSTHCPTGIPLKVIILRDSYGVGPEPFFSSYFRDVTYVWDNKIPVERILKEKPDILIWQFVERKLSGMGMPMPTVPEK